jgi:hypothetical protein
MKRKFKKDDVVVFTKKPSGIHMYGRKNWVGHVGIVVESDTTLILTKYDHYIGFIISCDYEEIEHIGSLD